MASSRFSRLSHRAKVRTGILAIAILVNLILFGLIVKGKLKEELRSIAQVELERSLKTNAEAVTQWLESQKASAKAIAANREIHRLSHKLRSDYMRVGIEKIIRGPVLRDLQERMKEYCHFMAYDDCTVVHKGVAIGAQNRGLIGKKDDVIYISVF